MKEQFREELHTVGIDELVQSINIPPQPALLQAIQAEIAKDEPDVAHIAEIARQDVALTAAVLKVVNSPFYGLRRNADTLVHAISFLGVKQITSLLTGFVARQAIKIDSMQMTRFWDVSSKRAFTMYQLSRMLRLSEPDIAQTFGLFCDLGIPLLMRRFPSYIETLGLANTSMDQTFTEVERAHHGTDHALVGAIMAKAWGLSAELSTAIRLHHDYEVLGDRTVAAGVQDLVCMGLLSEHIIQAHTGMNKSVEWERAGARALEHLAIAECELSEMKEDLQEAFLSA